MTAALHRIVILAGGLALAGCSALGSFTTSRTTQQQPVDPHAVTPLDRLALFDYTQTLLKMNREELDSEVVARREHLQLTQSALDHAKLALALTLPAQGQRDTTKALLAFSEVPPDDAAVAGHDRVLLSYVESLLAWQARQEDILRGLVQPEHGSISASGPPTQAPPTTEVANLQALAQRLRADQKRNEQQIDSLSQRLRDEKARADLLQQKIDALGNLEKSLAERKSTRTDPGK